MLALRSDGCGRGRIRHAGAVTPASRSTPARRTPKRLWLRDVPVRHLRRRQSFPRDALEPPTRESYRYVLNCRQITVVGAGADAGTKVPPGHAQDVGHPHLAAQFPSRCATSLPISSGDEDAVEPEFGSDLVGSFTADCLGPSSWSHSRPTRSAPSLCAARPSAARDADLRLAREVPPSRRHESDRVDHRQSPVHAASASAR